MHEMTISRTDLFTTKISFIEQRKTNSRKRANKLMQHRLLVAFGNLPKSGTRKAALKIAAPLF
jgi:hypothetical protein